MKNFLIIIAIALTMIGCGNKKQGDSLSQNKTESDTLVLPTPDLKLRLYAKEDSTKAKDKIMKAFLLHDDLCSKSDSIIADYHIICNDKKWLEYLTISYKADNFEILDNIISHLDKAYKNSKDYKWDEERRQYTNGRQYVYLQKPQRDESTGDIFAVCCIMPQSSVSE